MHCRALYAWSMLLALFAQGGAAHTPEHSKLRAVLDPLPPALSGVLVQVHETLAPQLVIENRTRHTLEILDDKNRAFIRIGPGGVEGDHNAPAWYLTFSTAPIPLPDSAKAADAPARWLTVRADPTWGWFDPRLHPGDTAPDDHHGAGDKPKARPQARKTFEIPVRVDGQTHLVSGRFLPKIVLPGRYEARLEGAVPAGLSVTVVQGSPPALLLRNSSGAAVTVLGLQNEPYLRIGPEGVAANAASETWRTYGRGRVEALSPGAEPQWRKLSPQPLYTWLEPRAEVDLSQPVKSKRQRTTVKRWAIPLLIGDQPLELKGATDWVPDPTPEN